MHEEGIVVAQRVVDSWASGGGSEQDGESEKATRLW